ncbi:histidine kinase dimerization/phospho-acceptor domain-containing protein [Paracoccaceae bacterium Fryx2]|nr:histidine kinase dimerization/phospho-acceptor domain-containing protein [Paracoccaceae bacterium Fryx2]
MTGARPPRSLRRDLVLGLSLGLIVLWSLAIVGAAHVARHELDEVFDSALQETAERILPLAVIELINSGPDGTPQRVSPVRPHEEYLTYVVRDRDGAIQLYSHRADLSVFGLSTELGFRTTQDHRLYAASAVSGAYTIEVAEPLNHRQAATLNTIAALLKPLLFLLPVTVLVIVWLTTVSLRPVAALSQEVRGRDASDLSPLVTRGLKAELLPVRDAVNRLMARLRSTLDSERSFTANAAHELRTPIAATLAQTQRLIAEAPEGPLRVRARAVEAELKRLARLSEKLLQLSRAEGGGVLAESAADMAPILAMVVDDFGRTGQDDRLRLTLPPEGAAPSRMDPDAFAILARNLIENALTHGDATAPVKVALDRTGRLRVINAGPVVAPDALARLTTRFERAGSRAAGSGLGLAIAASITRAAGHELTLLSPASGRADGFEARVTPPAADPETPARQRAS